MRAMRAPWAYISGKLLVLLAVVAAFVGALAIAFVGCSATVTTFTDFGVAAAACLAPRACYRPDCACNRASLDTCVICDPLSEVSQSCDCSAQTSTCLATPQVCVGRAATTCSSPGARCLPVGSSCDSNSDGGLVANPLEAAPQLVAVAGTGGDGGAPAFELRCAYADDVCCPGN